MEKACSYIKIIRNIKVNLYMENDKAMAYLNGLMAENIPAIGKMANSMDKVLCSQLLEFPRKESGKKVKKSNGLMKKLNNDQIYIFSKIRLIYNKINLILRFNFT